MDHIRHGFNAARQKTADARPCPNVAYYQIALIVDTHQCLAPTQAREDAGRVDINSAALGRCWGHMLDRTEAQVSS